MTIFEEGGRIVGEAVPSPGTEYPQIRSSFEKPGKEIQGKQIKSRQEIDEISDETPHGIHALDRTRYIFCGCDLEGYHVLAQ